MKRTTIQADSGLFERAHRLASKEKISFSELVRQGLELRMRQLRPRPKIAAIGSSKDGLSAKESAGGRVATRE